MESWHCRDLKFESNSRIHCNSPAHAIFCLVLMRLIKNPKTLWTVWEPAIAWSFRSRCQSIIQQRVDFPSVLWLINTAVQILVARFAFSIWKQLMSLKSVPCVIRSITVFKVCATLGIVTTKIGSWDIISAWSRWEGVIYISNRWRHTEFDFWSGYHFCSSPTILGKS